MMEESKGATCTASGVKVANDRGSVQFMCPKCGKSSIVRSSSSREIVAKYTCPKCGFEGPN